MLAQGAAYGTSEMGRGQRVVVEFVSANPTGPLHVGHGRHAAYGASLANLLEAAGYRVCREYYVNDAGRQMEILAASTWLRYLERRGERFTFPANGYRGDYLLAIAAELETTYGGSLLRPAAAVFADLPADEPQGGDKDLYIDAVIARARALLGAEDFRRVLDVVLGSILGDIREDLEEFGVTFDSWFSERSLSDSGAVDRAIGALEAAGQIYLKDGARWFRSTAYGDEKDRVIVRENGIKTYFASDIAFVFNKLARGFEHLIYVWGADHHGYIARLRAGLLALGGPPDCLEMRLVQFVTLFRGGAEGADVDPLGRVRDPARAARGGGQRCRAPVLRHALQRPAPRFRSGAGQGALQRQPGVLHPVRPCARRRACGARWKSAASCTIRRGASPRSAWLIEPQEQRLIKRICAYPETIEHARREPRTAHAGALPA